MDALSSVLAAIHITGSLLAYFQHSGTWGIDMSASAGFVPQDGIPFHHVVKGECWLVGDEQPRLLKTGDLILLPGWSPHILASQPDVPMVTIYDLIDRHSYARWKPGTTLNRPLTFFDGGDGADSVTLLTGMFSLSGYGTAQLLGPLPRFLTLNADDSSLGPQVRTILDFVLSEARSPKPGYVAVASRLMDLLFVQLLRAVSMNFALQPGLLNAVGHPRISQILGAIHEAPEYPWTLERLAEIGGLSRTTLMKSFQEIVGTTPICYLTDWRMHLARSALAMDGRRVSEVATAVGYSIPQCFSRAFKKASGMSPAEYRRRYGQTETYRAEHPNDGY